MFVGRERRKKSGRRGGKRGAYVRFWACAVVRESRESSEELAAAGEVVGSRWDGMVGWWDGGLFHYRRVSAGVIGACWTLSGGAYLAGQGGKKWRVRNAARRSTYGRRAE